MMWMWLACIVGAYVVGSIPFGVLLARSRGVDIRAHGSRNIGATNVGRVLGTKLGLLCFALDCLKGAVPVAVAGLVTGVMQQQTAAMQQRDMWLWLAVAVAAVLGHMCSIFLGLRGGKGVATGFGGLVSMWPLLTVPALAALIVWFTVLKSTRYMAMASMSGAVTLPVAFAVLTVVRADDVSRQLAHGRPVLAVTSLLALMVIYRHRSNIARLLRGEEPKMGPSKAET